MYERAPRDEHGPASGSVAQPATEPAADPDTEPGIEAAAEPAATLTLAREQQMVLRWTVASWAADTQHDLPGCYLLQRGDDLYTCAVDLALRSWLALADFVESTDPGTRRLFRLDRSPSTADRDGGDGGQGRPASVPHIRVATWGVPRTWFLLVREEERERYDADGVVAVRFRVPLAVARRRLEAARSLLTSLIDDEELS